MLKALPPLTVFGVECFRCTADCLLASCRCLRQIDVFSFGVLLAQLITGEYPRLDTRKEQVNC